MTSPASLSASMVSASDHLSSLRLFLLLIDPYQNYCGWSSSQPFPGRETAPPCSPPSLSLSPTPPWTPPALLTLPRQPLHWGGVNFLASAGNINQERICSCIWFFVLNNFIRSSSTLSLASTTSSQRLSPIDSIIKHLRCQNLVSVIIQLPIVSFIHFHQGKTCGGPVLWLVHRKEVDRGC